MMRRTELASAERIGTVLSELIARRGLSRLRQQEQWEQAWRETVGDSVSRNTRVGSVRGGIVEIRVNNSSLLQELAAFRKQELLSRFRQKVAFAKLRDIRFRLDESF